MQLVQPAPVGDGILSAAPCFALVDALAMRSYLRRFLPILAIAVAAYWALLFLGTHIPGGVGPDVDNLDKVAHFVAYALLAFALGSVVTVWQGYQAWVPLVVWSICFVYGAFDEFTQRFVPERTASLADLACDAAGAMLGLVAVYGCVLLARRFRAQTPILATSEAA